MYDKAGAWRLMPTFRQTFSSRCSQPACGERSKGMLPVISTERHTLYIIVSFGCSTFHVLHLSLPPPTPPPATQLRWYEKADLQALTKSHFREKRELLDTVAALKKASVAMGTGVAANRS